MLPVLCGQAALAIVLIVVTMPSSATPPLVDRLEYEGETTSFWSHKRTWVELPPSEKLQEMRRKERCSAAGGPRAKWRIADSQLWLTGLFRCSGDVDFSDVYDATAPVFANWITGQFWTHKGPRLCGHPYGRVIYEKNLIFDFEKGLLKKMTEVSNADHPAVPKHRPYEHMTPCLHVPQSRDPHFQ
jgi:hypothetical protein